MKPVLRDYQHQAVNALHKGYSKGLHRLGVQIPTGGGKGTTLDTVVPTPFGLHTVGDLKVGHHIYGSDGQLTQIIGVYDRGVLPTFRVTMKHGESVIVDSDHLWQVRRKGRKSRVVSTSWLLNQPLKDEDGWMWAIPVTKPVHRPHLELPLDPYVVGSLIANGGLTDRGTYLTTPDHQVIDRVSQYVKVTRLKNHPLRTCPSYYIAGIKSVTFQLGLRTHSRNKTIPRRYLEASIEQRIALLQGLMVGDGSVRHGGRRSLVYSTTSPRLVDDMQELISSLGGTCSFSKLDRAHDNKPIEYSLHILLPLDLYAFDTDRKIPDGEPKKLFRPRSAIISIEPAGMAEVRCIAVDAPNQLYLVTRNHIVTHNTVIMADISDKVITSARTSRVNILLHRDTLIEQTVRKLLAAGIDGDDIGVVKANRNEIDKRCLVVSIHSLRNEERMKLLPKPQLTVVDEAHVSVSPTYRRLYDWLGPAAYLAGFTATWMRSDRLGLGDVWEEVVFKRSIKWAVDRGYLVPPYPLQLGGDLDLSKVRTASDGDYNENDLGELIMVEDLRDTVVNAYHRITPGLSLALFAPTQASARFFAEALKASGVPTAEVFASTKPKDRKWAFHGFETGAIKILVSCSALAEGWDSPRCDGVISLRRTRFAGRFIQEIGRALRPWVNKDRAWILDFVGTLDEKDMAAAVDLSKTAEKEDIDQDLEECDECGEFRILRYVTRVQQSLCHDCFKELDLEPEQREHTAKKIDGVYQVDLFESTTARWLQTDFGMPFIATSEKSKAHIGRLYFLAPINGAWNVGVTGSVKKFEGGHWIAQGITATEAMTIGSDAALDDDPTIVHKKAAWRQNGRKATPQQIDFAKTLGVDVGQLSMAEASDAITIKLASRTLGSAYRDIYQQNMAAAG